MNRPRMNKLDLNLLYPLLVLAEQKSVSAAARKLGKSQPAVSLDLGKLRKFFNDPLFVRSGNEMHPTPRAEILINSARDVLERLGADIVATSAFDPATSDRVVSLALSDVGEVVFLPLILKELRRRLPNAMVRSVSLPASDMPRAMENSSIDLALGYFPDLQQGNFFQQTLFSDTFTSLVRVDHPTAGRKLSIKQYLQLEHAVVRAESRSEEVIERFLARRKLRRNVVLETPHFASAPIVVAQSDLIVTIPEPLARYFSSVSASLRVVELPFTPPRIPLKQFWHRKFHHDQRNRWLRTLIYELFEERRGGRPAARPAR
jgi:DNA-binding transcriptional LysR family regulator